MVTSVWRLAIHSVSTFLEDGCLSRGAAIAFYAVTSLGPVMLIIIAVAGLAYGEDAARGVLVERLSDEMGESTASFVQSAVGSAWRHGTGSIATILGILTLVLTATGMFSEMQTALNVIFRITPVPLTMFRLIRDKVISLALVIGLAAVLVFSVVIAAGISALQEQIDQFLPFASELFRGVDIIVSLALLTGIIAAIYKILPECTFPWMDVAVGALVTAVLITIGRVAISIYIGRSGVASSYGAAGSVMAALLWIYYSAQIFLLGAEFTRGYAERHELLKADRAERTRAEV
ncbi:MAG: YihY/virulence factor BrkB family protein [Acetobacteraceae bacterium]|nr:YihY/virulence factor BrkB family protein [Acetobacteraceae bacterium]